MTTPSDDIIIAHTQNWIQSFIIKLTLCPFAKQVVDKKTLRIEISHSHKVNKALEDLSIEIELLEKKPALETILLVFPSLFNDFFRYLDFVDLAEALMHEQGYEGIYQLATFHPDYCFADVDFDDLSNYTNRAPYPMIHILREESIEKAIAFYGNTEKIPERNSRLMHKLGIDELTKLLLQCTPKF